MIVPVSTRHGPQMGAGPAGAGLGTRAQAIEAEAHAHAEATHDSEPHVAPEARLRHEERDVEAHDVCLGDHDASLLGESPGGQCRTIYVVIGQSIRCRIVEGSLAGASLTQTVEDLLGVATEPDAVAEALHVGMDAKNVVWLDWEAANGDAGFGSVVGGLVDQVLGFFFANQQHMNSFDINRRRPGDGLS